MLNKRGGLILRIAIVIAILGVVFLIIRPQEFLKKLRVLPPPKEEAQPEEIVQVKAHKLSFGPFEDTLPVLGTIKGITQIELRFEVNGVVSAVNFNEGDTIHRGDLIAAIDQKDALLKLEFNKSKLRASMAQSKAAEKKLEIHQKLYAVGAIIKSKLEEVVLEGEASRAQVDSAQKEVDFAAAEVKKTFLYSPMDGVMGTREIDPGEYVTSQTKLGTVFDMSGIYVEVGIIEKDINKIQVGQKVKVNVDAYPQADFYGEVDRIPSLVEAKARTLPCKVRVDNPEALLKPGMFARSEIYVYQSESALMMPVTGLFDSDGDGNMDSAFIVDDEGKARLRRVKIGYMTTDKAEILDGLYEGENVVIETTKRLEDGVKVEVLEAGIGT